MDIFAQPYFIASEILRESVVAKNAITEAPPYQPSSETSRAGAECAKPSVATQCHTIVLYLALQGKKGATACELRRATGIGQASTMSARLNSLMNKGKIQDSGDRRKSKANVDNIVWVAL